MSQIKKRIGIFGGTFNPIHYGHLIIAENACHQFELDQVIFLPTGHAPHKPFMGEDMSEHRCRMVEQAIADNPKFSISYREIENTSINYTYKTLEVLKQEHSDTELYFILGADSLFDFPLWRHPELICRYATILAAVRDNLNEQEVDAQIEKLRQMYHGSIFRLDTPNFNVSSKGLRERIQRGETIRYMVPDTVEQYIHSHRLYQTDKSL
jgi:nicotinate-nucleotide adenylyltransferase